MTHIIIPIYSCGLCFFYGFQLGDGYKMKALDYITILFWPAMLIPLFLKAIHDLLLKIEYYDLLAAYIKYVVFHKWNKVENVKFLQRWVDTHGSDNIKTKITTKIIKLNS